MMLREGEVAEQPQWHNKGIGIGESRGRLDIKKNIILFPGALGRR